MSKSEPPKRRTRWRRLLVFLVITLVVAEVFLRTYLGFCDTVLMRADPHYEYIAQPDQDRCRFRQHIVYNSYSMRSEEPDTTAVLLLGCGDSVINGGVLTDQDSLATTILSRTLSRTFGRKVQFLNISAGSWGPDNCAAFLKNTALPKPRAIVLFASSHDAHDNMSFKKVVGVRKHFPDHQYPLALVELVDRYLLPRIIKPKQDTTEELGIDKGGDGFNEGFPRLKEHAQALGVPLVIYLHAERSEIKAGQYNKQGQEIMAFAEQEGIHLLKDLDHNASSKALRDNIHPDEKGQRFIATTVLDDMRDHPGSYGLEPAP